MSCSVSYPRTYTYSLLYIIKHSSETQLRRKEIDLDNVVIMLDPIYTPTTPIYQDFDKVSCIPDAAVALHNILTTPPLIAQTVLTLSRVTMV